jgi:hypothetical protein
MGDDNRSLQVPFEKIIAGRQKAFVQRGRAQLLQGFPFEKKFAKVAKANGLINKLIQ